MVYCTCKRDKDTPGEEEISKYELNLMDRVNRFRLQQNKDDTIDRRFLTAPVIIKKEMTQLRNIQSSPNVNTLKATHSDIQVSDLLKRKRDGNLPPIGISVKVG